MIIKAQVVIQRLTEVIDATPEDEKDFQKPWAEIPGHGDLTCTKLNFHHADRVDLLEDFSVTIPGGKVIALIGQSGCGKITLAKLIAGLYSSKSGNIRYGNYNQQDLSLECLRQQVVLVPQEPHFWSRSIIANFRFSYPHVTFEQIVKACQIAEANEFISELPDKYQTVLGEFGANLSGGQKQRLAIARAIVTDPPILILDESTGALDPVSEAKVLDRLLEYRQGKTTILISHRPKVIQRADCPSSARQIVICIVVYFLVFWRTPNINFWGFGVRQILIFGVFTIANWVKCDRAKPATARSHFTPIS